MSQRRRERAPNPVSTWLGHGAARLAVELVGAMPEALALSLARGLGRIAVRVDRGHSRLARANLDLAYGGALAPAERERIVVESYCNLLLIAVETVHAVRRARRGEPPVELEIEGARHIEGVAKSGRGALFVSCHMGNWELCPIGPARYGAPLHSIATPRRNPLIDRMVIDMRESLGQTVVWKQGSFREALRLLQEGRFVGVLADQNQRKGAVFVDFFGTKASTTRGPALLARRAGVPLLPAAIRRLPGRNRHRLTVTEPIEPIRTASPEEDVVRMTRAYTERLEMLIREAPGQWLWLHRRWRTRPWREIRLERDTRCIARAAAANPHGLGPSLEPPAADWEDMPAAVRRGVPAPRPILRNRTSIGDTGRLSESLHSLRKQQG